MNDVATPNTPEKGLISPFAGAAAPVRKIGIVGGLLDSDGDLSDNDLNVLLRCLDICSEKGIEIDPDVDVVTQDLINDHDFLEQPAPVDMVLFSSIPHNPNGIGGLTVTRQSPHALEPGIWHESLLKSGARYAFNIYNSGPMNLPNNLLEGPVFKVLDILPAGQDQDLNYALLCR